MDPLVHVPRTLMLALCLSLVTGCSMTTAPATATPLSPTAALPTATVALPTLAPTATVTPAATPVPTPLPTAAPTIAAGVSMPGSPAISPRYDASNPMNPTFLAFDGMDWIRAHPPTYTRGQSVTIVWTTFLPMHEVEAQMGMHLPLVPDQLLFVARVTWPSSPQVPAALLPGTVSPLSAGNVAYEFFDAHTGNYLGSQMG